MAHANFGGDGPVRQLRMLFGLGFRYGFRYACRQWLDRADRVGLERATVQQYRQHLKLHITPEIGEVKLARFTVPMARAFEDKLAKDRSPAMVPKVMRSLGAILADAQERGLVAQNVVWNLSRGRRGGGEARADRRRRGKLKVGVDIPTPDEIRTLITHLKDRRRELLLTAIFTGLRSSELRGLRWGDIDLKRAVLHVRQRADRYRQMGRPKSAAGERTIPLPPLLLNTLREWKLACPKSERDLAFCNGHGNPDDWKEIVHDSYRPAQVAARGGQRQRAGEVRRPARAAAFLRELVHQPARRWRPRTSAQAGAGPPRPRLDPDDGGSLRPPVPERRRWCRAGSGREGFVASDQLTPRVAKMRAARREWLILAAVSGAGAKRATVHQSQERRADL
jgi:integrase